MSEELFRMDHGKGRSTQLYRRQMFTRSDRWEWRWVDLHGQIEFGDEDGHPVDVFGLPVLGEFISPTKMC